jgi:ferredoxin-NADP reductase
MAEHTVRILESVFINHDVKRLRIERPPGYTFVPGQGTYVTIDAPDAPGEARPFTFTSLQEWPDLELIIRIYREHHGVTERIGRLRTGDRLRISEPFGAITYKGPGVFFAGGTGITPFLAIFRQLHHMKLLRGNRLVYTNRTVDDVIMHEELTRLLRHDYINVFTRQNVIGFRERRIDREMLIELAPDLSQRFYICGPEGFVRDIRQGLLELGADGDALVVEA